MNGVLLHDDNTTFIDFGEECPFDRDFIQEEHILEFYNYLRSQLLPLPIIEWPKWLSDGVGVLSRCDERETHRKERETTIG